ncbi:hypothetical protein ACH49_08620 [Streptomyces leeuwenhoekii]|uniref:Uncharacterized protein n=1 Tax=Streptomyces leeuwenhoekii TaxID=1437453 RepID=A0ABR5I1R4_STRLW|nr:hypothetical protein ACH49_08620 [Streptomyces leeuwenhoekii]
MPGNPGRADGPGGLGTVPGVGKPRSDSPAARAPRAVRQPPGGPLPGLRTDRGRGPPPPAGPRPDGRTAGRPDGGTAGWRDGRTAGWRDGRMEGRSDGPMEGRAGKGPGPAYSTPMSSRDPCLPPR